MSMLGMLVVLGLIIFRAGDPSTWDWLAADESAANQPAAPQGAEGGATLAATDWKERVTPGLTEEDPDERAAALEEFQAVSDGNVELGAEEMPTYWRLFDWVQHQSTAEMRKRASREVIFNQFIRNPGEKRGQLFQIELNVRRVLSYPAPPNKAGIKTVYEIWGWTTESKAWLFEVLAAELPPGMPVGTDVHERVTFTGYFYKLQGYHEAGAGPRDKPLPAPLLIGRITWKPSELEVARNQPQNWTWAWWVGGLALVFSVLRTCLWVWGRRTSSTKRRGSERTALPGEDRDVQHWLANAQRDANRPVNPFTDFHSN